MIDPNMLQRLLIADAMGPTGPAQAIDEITNTIQKCASGVIPDRGDVRKALDAWGISYKEGASISQLMSQTPALNVTLPEGWEIKREGGHHNLVDNRDRNRIWWYIHGWDPIDVRINRRFGVRRQDPVIATEGITLVRDGDQVIKSVTIHYPRPLESKPRSRGGFFYFIGNLRDNGWKEADRTAAYKAQSDAEAEARAWLDDNFPGWRDPILAWSL